MKTILNEHVSVEVFPRSVDIFSDECRISLDEKAMNTLVGLWQSAQQKDAPDLAKAGEKDGPVRIKHVHGNTFRMIDPPNG